MVANANRMWSWLVNKISITPPSSRVSHGPERSSVGCLRNRARTMAATGLLAHKQCSSFGRFGARISVKRKIICWHSDSGQ